MSKLKQLYFSCRNAIILFYRRQKSIHRIEIRNKIPRLVVSEKYKKIIKWTLRPLAAIGIVSSLFTLPWYLSLPFSIFLFLFSEFLCKVVFTYHTIFVQPLPEWDSEEWRGMIYGYRETEKGYDSFKVGVLFRTEEYARKIFKCLRAWNYDNDIDNDNNTNISFIIEDNSKYSPYLYASHSRKTIKQASNKIEEDMLKKRNVNEQQQLVVGIVICKVFDNPPNSNFRKFSTIYKNGMPFLLSVFYTSEKIPDRPFIDEEGLIKEIMDINPIIKNTLKIKKRSELSKDEVEYQHGKFTMKIV